MVMYLSGVCKFVSCDAVAADGGTDAGTDAASVRTCVMGLV